jgi:hypothetical protein
MGATLDGVVEVTGAVFKAKFMLPWSFSEEFADENYMAQLQQVITGGGKWVEIVIHADALYQQPAFDRREEILALRADRRAWRERPCGTKKLSGGLFGQKAINDLNRRDPTIFAYGASQTERPHHLHFLRGKQRLPPPAPVGFFRAPDPIHGSRGPPQAA